MPLNYVERKDTERYKTFTTGRASPTALHNPALYITPASVLGYSCSRIHSATA